MQVPLLQSITLLYRTLLVSVATPTASAWSRFFVSIGILASYVNTTIDDVVSWKTCSLAPDLQPAIYPSFPLLTKTGPLDEGNCPAAC